MLSNRDLGSGFRVLGLSIGPGDRVQAGTCSGLRTYLVPRVVDDACIYIYICVFVYTHICIYIYICWTSIIWVSPECL